MQEEFTDETTRESDNIVHDYHRYRRRRTCGDSIPGIVLRDAVPRNALKRDRDLRFRRQTSRDASRYFDRRYLRARR